MASVNGKGVEGNEPSAPFSLFGELVLRNAYLAVKNHATTVLTLLVSIFRKFENKGCFILVSIIK